MGDYCFNSEVVGLQLIVNFYSMVLTVLLTYYAVKLNTLENFKQKFFD